MSIVDAYMLALARNHRPGFGEEPRTHIDDGKLVPSEISVATAPVFVDSQGELLPAGKLVRKSIARQLLLARRTQDARQFTALCSRNGFRKAQDQQSRATRLLRTQMLVAQQEAGYRVEYLIANAWAQGPFFGDEAGRWQYERATANASRSDRRPAPWVNERMTQWRPTMSTRVPPT